MTTKTIKKSKKRTSFENYTMLLIKLETMRNTPFKYSAFIKAIQPFCETHSVKSKTIMSISIRGAKYGIWIRILDNYFVVQPAGSVHEFHFYLSSGKSLLTKLINHNILKP